MISLRHVCRRYGNIAAVDNMSLHVQRGELLVLLGRSGSGKTTTLKLINRLIELSSGSIHIGEQDIRSMPPHRLRRQIGYVFQKIGLFPHLTVTENIAMTPQLLGWDKKRIEHQVNAMLELVELEPAEFRDRYPDHLSGGQQQRVGVARALAAEPRVMLLDEPFSALDPITRDNLRRAFFQIQRKLCVTSVFVTHDIAEAQQLADRVAVMREGHLVQVGSVQALMNHPADGDVAQLWGNSSAATDGES